jgi:hypothetical protein
MMKEFQLFQRSEDVNREFKEDANRDFKNSARAPPKPRRQTQKLAEPTHCMQSTTEAKLKYLQEFPFPAGRRASCKRRGKSLENGY